MILFDTTFLIDLLAGDEGAVKVAEVIDTSEEVPALSVASMHEYLVGVHLKHHKGGRLAEMLEAAEGDLSRFRIVPINSDVARLSARINAELRQGGKMIGMNDIYIAATAMHLGIELVTRNAKHFRLVPGLHVRTY